MKSMRRYVVDRVGAAVGALLIGVISPGICAAAQGSDQMTPDLMQAVRQAQHAVEADGADYRAWNRANHHRIDFKADGIELTPSRGGGDWAWGLRLTGYGSPEAIAPVAAAERTIQGQRIEYHRGPITEWYENRFVGIEQGFILAKFRMIGTQLRQASIIGFP